MDPSNPGGACIFLRAQACQHKEISDSLVQRAYQPKDTAY